MFSCVVYLFYKCLLGKSGETKFCSRHWRETVNRTKLEWDVQSREGGRQTSVK